ncbi:hypothetical protein [Deinococcus humi]|uniref:Phosphoadenosine phosphosulphate reductase domain-containing protein n=1 Tax=Deinococcus humi TaxID=662880 RepID=A0A7W8JR17_9DEIO|nr:hypothetical protein [Deinococcus humi]MBB5361360.1 hypothetical protein [Deinococcus humi]GGO19652.1 hypothetical protein GCM10008949_04220 [Deinococcus humi]
MSAVTILSNGGGVQSTAMLALILQGKLPRPDYVVMADTGREKTATWDYVQAVHCPACEALGIPLVIVPHSYSTVDLYAGNGGVLMPMYTTQGGGVSKLPTYCSNEWKQRPVRRWLREQGVKSAVQWLGISMDECDRMKPSGMKWIVNAFPLIDLGVSRDGCYAAIREQGWPDAPKSSCLMCPHMGDAQWKHLRSTAPADFQTAVEVEREIRARDPHAFLHRSARPLNEVKWDEQPSLFEDDTVTCAASGCWL